MNEADTKIYRSALDALDAFGRWYQSTGHWVYPNRADALRTWEERGIEGLPDHPREAQTTA